MNHAEIDFRNLGIRTRGHALARCYCLGQIEADRLRSGDVPYPYTSEIMSHAASVFGGNSQDYVDAFNRGFNIFLARTGQ